MGTVFRYAKQVINETYIREKYLPLKADIFDKQRLKECSVRETKIEIVCFHVPLIWDDKLTSPFSSLNLQQILIEKLQTSQ